MCVRCRTSSNQASQAAPLAVSIWMGDRRTVARRNFFQTAEIPDFGEMANSISTGFRYVVPLCRRAECDSDTATKITILMRNNERRERQNGICLFVWRKIVEA